MNYLAHVYLSHNDGLISVGNFIGDYVKGKQFEAFPTKIREGILLHRAIDTYTDSHPLTADARSWMHPLVGKYAGIYLDIFYDHFLAANWSSYSKLSLRRFTYRFYLQMLVNYKHLPANVKSFLPNLILSNRLYTYRKVEGIQRALVIMSAYTSLPFQVDEAIHFLKDNYGKLGDNFMNFFDDLIHYTEKLNTNK